jgi:hypothetical protein
VDLYAADLAGYVSHLEDRLSRYTPRAAWP